MYDSNLLNKKMGGSFKCVSNYDKLYFWDKTKSQLFNPKEGISAQKIFKIPLNPEQTEEICLERLLLKARQLWRLSKTLAIWCVIKCRLVIDSRNAILRAPFVDISKSCIASYARSAATGGRAMYIYLIKLHPAAFGRRSIPKRKFDLKSWMLKLLESSLKFKAHLRQNLHQGMSIMKNQYKQKCETSGEITPPPPHTPNITSPNGKNKATLQKKSI